MRPDDARSRLVLSALRLHILLAMLLALSAVYPVIQASSTPYAADGRWHELSGVLLLAALTAAVLTRLIRRATRRHWLISTGSLLLFLAVLLKFALSTGPGYAWLPTLPVIALTGFLTVSTPALQSKL